MRSPDIAIDMDACVVGAGAAGLAAGLALLDAGKDFEVLEEAAEPGGNMRAIAQDGAMLATGPQAFARSAANAWWLIDRAGLRDRVTLPAQGSARFIFRNDQLHRVPSGPLGFATTSLLSARGKLRMLAEPFQSSRAAALQESVRSFFSRRLGAEAVNALVAPFVTGIHAADPDTLEACSAFPSLVHWERTHGSLLGGALAGAVAAAFSRVEASQPPLGAPRTAKASLYSVRGGLSVLAQRCGAALGARLRLSTPTVGISRDNGAWRVVTTQGERRCRHLVLAVPAPRAAELLRASVPEAARLAASVPMASVGVVHLGGELLECERARAPGGFGVLIARGEGLRSLGCVFTSALFPDVAPPGSWLQATYVGGALDPHILDEDDEALRRLVVQETRRVLGIDPDRGIFHVVRHGAGIPQMTIGHADRIRALRGAVASAGSLSLAGNWLDGIGLDAAIASGRAASAEVA